MTRRGRRRVADGLRSILLAGGLCLAAAVTSHGEDHLDGREHPPAPEIVVTKAARACFTGLIHASGYLVPRRTAVVMFASPGYRIAEVRAKVGDTIKRGDIVARAAPADPPLGAALGKPGPADVAVTSLASGLVLQSSVFPGMLTSPTPKPLLTLAVDGEIEAAVDVPSAHVLELQPGQPAHLTMGDGSVRDGHVRRTPVEVDRATQMGSTRLAIDKVDGLDLSRFVRATIEARRSCGIGVPMTALRRTSTGTSVQVVEDGVILGRAVRLGLGDATDMEVTSGLAEGDMVVASAGASREGDRVRPVPTDMRDAR